MEDDSGPYDQGNPFLSEEEYDSDNSSDSGDNPAFARFPRAEPPFSIGAPDPRREIYGPHLHPEGDDDEENEEGGGVHDGQQGGFQQNKWRVVHSPGVFQWRGELFPLTSSHSSLNIGRSNYLRLMQFENSSRECSTRTTSSHPRTRSAFSRDRALSTMVHQD